MFLLASIIIPKSVKQIGNHPFSGNESSIVVEKGNLYYDSRNNCNAIIDSQTNTLIQGCINTIIPNDVVSIAKQSFYNSKTFYEEDKKNLTIPKNVTYIGNEALRNNWIKALIMESSIPPTLYNNYVIQGNDREGFLIYVPDGAVNTYKNSSYWNYYSQRIKGISGLET